MKTKSKLITNVQAAEIIGVKPTYLAYLRHVHRHDKLPYEKRNGSVYYRLEDVEKFRDKRNEKINRLKKKAEKCTKTKHG